MSSTAPALLSPDQIARLLQSGLESIDAELAGLPREVATWHPAPGEWCANEVLGHLIEAERRGFATRVRELLLGQPLVSWDQEAVARARNDCAKEPATVLAEFTTLRRDSVALVQGLRPEDLARGGDHPVVGFMAVQDLLHEWVHHDRNHFRQLLANVQAYAWPHMGNCQKFSTA